MLLMKGTNWVIKKSISNQVELRQSSQVFKKTWQSAYRAIFTPDKLAGLDATIWEQNLTQAGRFNCIALADQQVVGVVSYGALRSGNKLLPGYGELRAIYVLPEYQHLGIGQALITQAETGLKFQNYHKIILWVLAANMTAQEFYQRNGYRKTGNTDLRKILGKKVVLQQYTKII